MRTFAICLVVSLGGVAAASDLTGTLTVDNEFNAYLSTNDSQLGTLVASSTNWNAPQSFTVSLTPGTTYYLHVVGDNTGGPDMFIGSFNVGSGFTFSNGTSALDTNTTDWKGNLTGFGNAYSTPLDYGVNGTGAWGNLASISPTAHFIWMDGTDAVGVNNYFTTTIHSAPVPEPASMSALALGAIGLLARRRKKAR